MAAAQRQVKQFSPGTCAGRDRAITTLIDRPPAAGYRGAKVPLILTDDGDSDHARHLGFLSVLRMRDRRARDAVGQGRPGAGGDRRAAASEQGSAGRGQGPGLAPGADVRRPAADQAGDGPRRARAERAAGVVGPHGACRAGRTPPGGPPARRIRRQDPGQPRVPAGPIQPGPPRRVPGDLLCRGRLPGGRPGRTLAVAGRVGHRHPATADHRPAGRGPPPPAAAGAAQDPQRDPHRQVRLGHGTRAP